MRIEILSIQSSQQVAPNVKETSNLHIGLSVLMIATLPRVEFLKVKPKMWEQESKLLWRDIYNVTMDKTPR